MNGGPKNGWVVCLGEAVGICLGIFFLSPYPAAVLRDRFGDAGEDVQSMLLCIKAT